MEDLRGWQAAATALGLPFAAPYKDVISSLFVVAVCLGAWGNLIIAHLVIDGLAGGARSQARGWKMAAVALAVLAFSLQFLFVAASPRETPAAVLSGLGVGYHLWWAAQAVVAAGLVGRRWLEEAR